MWFYLVIGALFLFYLLYYHFSTSGPTMTGQATVISHRMELSKAGSLWSDNYNRLITFRLSDGEELELYVDKDVYSALEDGKSGQLTWRQDMFVSFDGD